MNKNFVKILSALTAVVMLSFVMVGAAPGTFAYDGAGSYPTVFVHGLFGWGADSDINDHIPYFGMNQGDLMDFLSSQGYPVAVASVGPLSSCHDRTCELFAQLCGSRVDYGAAHSAKYQQEFEAAGHDLRHDRYGRDYSGRAIIQNWGPIRSENGFTGEWYQNKVNLVGHSFGGPTATMLLHYLAEGNAEEIAWGKEQAAQNGGDWHDYVSPLFWGDYNGQLLVSSITSLSGVLNGTDFISAFGLTASAVMRIFISVANTLGLTEFGSFYDCQLDHMGLTSNPRLTENEMESYWSMLNQKGFFDSNDQALYDLTVEGANKMKQGWRTYDSVYYFSYAGNKTYPLPTSARGHCVADPDILFLMSAWSTTMGRYTSSQPVLAADGGSFGSITREWFPNDGLVNTLSARYVFGNPEKRYDRNNIEPGVWQWKDMDYDHLHLIGGLVPHNLVDTKLFYLEIMDNIYGKTEHGDVRDLPFTDLAQDEYFESINGLYQKGIVEGLSSTLFAPGVNMNRAQFVKALARMSGDDTSFYNQKRFLDVPATLDHANFINWAYENGVANPISSRTFGSGIFLNKEDLARTLYNYAVCCGIELYEDEDAPSYSDEGSMSPECLQAAKALSWIFDEFREEQFSPKTLITRAEAASYLWRFYNSID